MHINGITRAFISSFFAFLVLILITTPLFASNQASTADNKTNTVIFPQIFDMAKKNENWKVAFITGKDAQVVFMNINPNTNPDNEIGMENHDFDQIIFVVEGQAQSIINGNKSTVSAGDMIFIHQGVVHNFINLDDNKPFKIISVYSSMDIPKDAVYKHKSDMPPE